jgi:putative toxin-antitoxin system antitoxin component (TIGR02293 family)
MGSSTKQLTRSHLSAGTFVHSERISGRATKANAASIFQDHARIVRGIPYKYLRSVAISVGMMPEDLAKRIGVSRTTFHRKMRNPSTLLSTQESNALARYGILTDKARDTFGGDATAARKWLGTAQPGLGNAVPLEIAQTTPGFQEVEKLLTRIDYGVYA